ncbi:MAG: hypothetical protein QXJ06_00750 [Candidatus Aenigmatarchaeota archaeon]
MNSFDACLATFSLLVANYIAGIDNNYVVLILSITAGISMAISGFWGSIFVEHVEQQKQLKKLQTALLTNLEGTLLRGDYETSSLLLAIINGLSPVVISVVIVSPFLFLETFYAYYVAFSIVVLLLLALGLTMARIGKTNSFYFILKFFSAAIFAVILIVLINNALNYIK